MKKFVVVLALLALAAPAWAIEIKPNIRPVSVANGDAGEPSLQYLLNGTGPNGSSLTPPPVFPGAAINVQTDQSEMAFFMPSSLVGTSTPTLWFEWTSGYNGEFGLYSINNDTISTLPIFFGAAEGFSQWPSTENEFATGAMISFSQTGKIKIEGSCGAVNCVSGSTAVNAWNFGFYFTVGGRTFYTLDSLNDDGLAHVLAFRDPNAPTEWLFALEDNVSQGGDFQDVGVKVESIKPIPEPGSMLLLGSGLFGLAGAARRRFAKK